MRFITITVAVAMASCATVAHADAFDDQMVNTLVMVDACERAQNGATKDGGSRSVSRELALIIHADPETYGTSQLAIATVYATCAGYMAGRNEMKGSVATMALALDVSNKMLADKVARLSEITQTCAENDSDRTQ